MVACSQCSIYVGWPEPRQVGEQAGELSYDTAVRSGIGEEEEGRFGRVVPTLQVDVPNECLDIANAHHELDRRPGAASEEHRIPRSLLEAVLGSRQWDLELVTKRRCNEFEESA